MNIPTIGGAQGIFEIFVPGMFLLLNLVAVVYLFPFTDSETKRLLSASVSNAPLLLVIAITFGYLIGILLRLFSPDRPDNWSAAWQRRFNRNARAKDRSFKLYASERFPYIGWLGEICSKYLPPEAKDFYDKVWLSRKLEERNKPFFNYCKALINTHDQRSSAEIYTAESLTRYISGMFYALVLSSIGILLTVILQRVLYGQAMAGLILLLLAYLFSIIVIVRRFRNIRLKEVETVFAASLKNREIFLKEDQELQGAPGRPT
ncbi:MAG: hypothetical protein KJ065_08205 [Anaerolineae bacterium]|nr:hypothetical protein [Anaerolineae bacterium]